MFFDEDARRQFEAHRDLVASTPNAITPVVELQAALTYSAGRLRAAHQRHAAAVGTLLRESIETQAARAAQFKAAGAVDQAWRYLRGRVLERLLNPPPEVELTADEREKRLTLVGQIFPHPAAEFARQTPERKVLLVRSVLSHLDAQRPLLGEEADDAHRRLPPLANTLSLANDTLNSELRESQAAQDELVQARAEHDRLHAAYIKQVEGALGDADRLSELPRYIRARDPAYRARRAAGRSMKEEEGIEAITTPLGTTPDAIEAPAPT